MHIKDILDIAIISVSIYFVLIFIKQTRTFLIFESLLVLFGLNFIAQRLDLSLTRQLIEPLFTFFVVVIIIVFQPELRRFIKWISSGRRTQLNKVLSLPQKNIETIVRAVFEMAKKKVGAIIVLPGEYDLSDLIEGGFVLNGTITAAILQSIFDPTSPGHDGAVLIDGSEIKMFGLHLPLAREFTDYKRLGTRHRAAAGITERTDALSIVVSEERGEVSVSTKGQLQKVKTPEELTEIIAAFTGHDMKNTGIEDKGFLYFFLIQNSVYKGIAIALATILWVIFT